jgi:NADPH2:quinone reductase
MFISARETTRSRSPLSRASKAPGLWRQSLSQKGSQFLTRPILFDYTEGRDALEASAKELFEVVASGKVRIKVNQRFALKDAADAHKALEARATSGSTVLTI